MVQVVELPTQPAPLGLADLGAALAQGAEGYVSEQEKRRLRQQQLDDEARRRTEQLQDVASERDYQTQRDASTRALDRSDFDYQEAARQRVLDLHNKGEYKQKVIDALISEHYLSPDDVDKPGAFASAYAAAKKDGLVQRYNDLISRGYLKVDQIDDPKAVDAAQAQAAADSTAAFKAGPTQKANVSAYVNQLYAAHQNTVARLEAAEAAANSDPSQATPSPADVNNLAAQMARAANPGQTLTPAMVAEQAQAAGQKLMEQAMYAQQQRNAQAKVLLPALQRQAASEAAQLENFSKQGIVPTALPTDDTAGDNSTALAQPQAAPPPNARAAAIAALAGKAPPAGAQPAGSPAQVLQQPGPVGAAPAPTPAALQPLPNTNNDALIAQENQRRQAAAQQASAGKWQTNLANPYDETLDKIQELTQLANNLRNPPNIRGEIPQDPQQRAEQLAQVNAQLAALQTQLLQRKRKMLGVPDGSPLGMPATGAATGVPTVSDANGSVPTAPPNANWWAPTSTMAGAATMPS
jgi:hypothetical protein